MPIIFDNDYTGPRYRYASLLRPCSFANIPDGCIILSQRKHSKYLHGTVDYPAPLTDAQVDRFDMVLLETIEAITCTS